MFRFIIEYILDILSDIDRDGGCCGCGCIFEGIIIFSIILFIFKLMFSAF